jgi:hypothetical protein
MHLKAIRFSRKTIIVFKDLSFRENEYVFLLFLQEKNVTGYLGHRYPIRVSTILTSLKLYANAKIITNGNHRHRIELIRCFIKHHHISYFIQFAHS